MRRLGLIILAVAVLAGAAALRYALREPHRAAENAAGPGTPRPAVAVRVAEVSLRDSQEFQQFAGSVQSRLSVQVSARIVAHILELKAHSGQQVKKDDVLVRLDDADVRTRIKQAEAGVGAAEAGVRAAEADLVKAQAARVEADQDLKRFQDLFKAGAAPQQQLQQAEAKAKTAVAGVDRAQEGITEARRQVDRAKAQVKEAEANLEFTVIRSPMDGVVVEKQAEQGDLAAPGRPLLTLQSPTALWFEAPVSEHCARRIALGDRARVMVEATQTDLSVEVTEIVPAVDPKSRSFLVRANLPAQAGLQPGLFGRLQFPCAARQVLSIPASALVSRGQLDLVFVEFGGVARLRLVTLGRAQGDWVEVLSGLSKGERIVVKPPPGLRDNDPLTIQAEAK